MLKKRKKNCYILLAGSILHFLTYQSVSSAIFLRCMRTVIFSEPLLICRYIDPSPWPHTSLNWLWMESTFRLIPEPHNFRVSAISHEESEEEDFKGRVNTAWHSGHWAIFLPQLCTWFSFRFLPPSQAAHSLLGELTRTSVPRKSLVTLRVIAS